MGGRSIFFIYKISQKNPQNHLAEVSRKVDSLLTVGGFPSSWKRDDKACEASHIAAGDLLAPRESPAMWSGQTCKNLCCVDMNLKH